MEQLSPQLMHKLVFTVLMHGLNDSQTALALRLLTDALTHPNAQIRELAVVAIADLSVPAAKRVQALTPGLNDASSRVRRRAARAIGDQGPSAQAALSQLTGGLTDADASVRRDCAGALGRMGPAAHPAADALLPLLLEPEGRTRAIATTALKRIGKGSVPALLDGLRSPSAELRDRCAALLAQVAPGDAGVLAAVHQILDDADALPAADEDALNGPRSGITPAGAGV